MALRGLLLLGCCCLLVAGEPDCFEWGLRAGMRLVYHVDADDTLAMAGDPVLIRHRQEQWEIVCDRVDGDTIFLRQTLLHYRANEATSTGDSSIRRTIPWVGHSTRIVMTRRGWRIHTQLPQTDTFSVVPGGVFGPVLFVPLDSVCVRCGGTQWLIESRDTLVEYACPPAMLERMFLASVDSCPSGKVPHRISIAETSRGVHRVRTPDLMLETTAWILAHSIVELDTQYHVPARVLTTQQIRLAIESAAGKPRRGEQRTGFRAQLKTITTPKRRPQR